MKIRIMVDSSCDISQDEAKKLDVQILPLKINFGEEEYLDGVNISKEEFFTKLASSEKLPHTSMLSSYAYQEYFSQALNEVDYVICLTISSQISGCYQQALLAQQEFGTRVKVIDSENVSIGLKILIQYISSLVKKDMSIDEIVDKINVKKQKIRVIALLDTLEYLRKGGRISNFTSTLGCLLNIKPVITIEEGKVKFFGKARGSKNGNNKLREYIADNGGIDYTSPYCLAYSGLKDDNLQVYIKDHHDLLVDENYDITLIGASIGTHIGPGAIAVAFFVK
jgi:DegV family protein with EDD domain